MDIIPQQHNCSRAGRLFVLYLAQDREIQRSGVVKEVSVDDAIFYDQFVSDKTIKDRSSYLSNGTYIIEEIPRSATVELLR